MRAGMRGSLVLLIALSSVQPVCSAGFYEVRKVAVSRPWPGVELNGPVPSGAVGEKSALRKDEYLTITAYSDFENARPRGVTPGRRLQLLVLEAEIKDAVSNRSLSTPLLTIDLKSSAPAISSMHTFDFLRAYPIPTAAIGNVDITFRARAVERSAADQFILAFKAVTDLATKVTAVGGLILSPLVTGTMDVASNYLQTFYSGDTQTSSEAKTTLNSPGYSLLQPEAIILVPLYGSPKDVAARLESLRAKEFVACSSGDGLRLCWNDGGTARAFSDHAWILLVPSSSGRVTHPSLLGYRLVGNGPCTIGRTDVLRHLESLGQLGERLTPMQRILEEQIGDSAGNFVAIKDSFEKRRPDVAFASLSSEWNTELPAVPLYSLEGPWVTYKAMQKQLRECILNEGDRRYPPVFSTYASVLDEIRKKPAQVEQYEAILNKVGGLEKILTAYDLQIAEVTSLIAAQRSIVESTIFEQRFQPWIRQIDDPAVSPAQRRSAITELTRLIPQTACRTCIDKANQAIRNGNARIAEIESANALAAAATTRDSLAGFLASIEIGSQTSPTISEGTVVRLTEAVNSLGDASEAVSAQPSRKGAEGLRNVVARAGDVESDATRELQESAERLKAQLFEAAPPGGE